MMVIGLEGIVHLKIEHGILILLTALSLMNLSVGLLSNLHNIEMGVSIFIFFAVMITIFHLKRQSIFLSLFLLERTVEVFLSIYYSLLVLWKRIISSFL